MELFGRAPNPNEPPSKANKPVAFHIYSMRQAIEENYILDVLKNYTSYKVAWQLAQKVAASDTEVDARKARVKLGQWVRLHDYNIAQKVQAIVEHFRDKVAGLLGGHAKAMVVTASRKEAVRYKLGFDKYVQERGYRGLTAMVAFSGEVEFNAQDPNVGGLLGIKFTETSMNPVLKGRDLRKAFDTDDYHVMIVVQKFFTRYYEFMSQIVDYDSSDLEKLSLYARHLAPLLREKTPQEDPVDLSSVELSHYRLSKIRQ
jgi:type I restriction enzyme R subunit